MSSMQRVGKSVRSVFTTLLDAQISRFQAERAVQAPLGPKYAPNRVFESDQGARFTDRARQEDEERDAIRMAFGMGAVTDKPSAN